MKAPCNRPTAVDLFAGAGGLSEGFIQAGFHVVASVERDPLATETQRLNHTYRKRCRTEVITADIAKPGSVIAKLHETGIDGVDAAIGGPPCQGFSRSNMRTRNERNPNNCLFRKFIEVAIHYRPRVIVMENVADMVTTYEKGCVADEIIAALREAGYEAEWTILNAVHFGVPQYRNRAFFIGVRDGIRIEFPTRLLTEVDDFVSVGDAIFDLPRLPNGAGVDEMPYRSGRELTAYQQAMRRRTNGRVRNNLVTQNGELVLERYRHIPQGGNWRDIPDRLMRNYADKERCHQWIYRRLPANRPSVTVSNYRKNMLIHPRQDRGLSVREAARLQSFPDHFAFAGGIGFQQQQVANAVPPLVAKAVAMSVRNMLGR